MKDLKRRIGVYSFREQFPDLFNSIRENQEIARRALSGPTIEELHRAEMRQICANIHKQANEQMKPIFFDEKEN